MRKGILFTITTSILLVSLFALHQSFLERQKDQRTLIAGLELGGRLFYVWDDVKDDIEDITDVLIEKIDYNITFYDKLPADGLDEFLDQYGEFLKEFYETPDMDIKFISSTGEEIEPEILSPKIRIMPFGIEYYYPDFGKNELHIDSPPENFSAIEKLVINISNITPVMTYDPVTQPEKFKWSPNYQECGPGSDYCLNLSIFVSDNSKTWSCPECANLVDVENKQTIMIQLSVDEPANHWVKITIGPLPQVAMVQFLNVEVHVETTFVMNTTEFYVEHLSKLLVNSSDYGTYKLDWI